MCSALIVFNVALSLFQDGRSVESSRIVSGSSFSFDVSTIHRWGDHPVLSNVVFFVQSTTVSLVLINLSYIFSFGGTT